MANFEFNIAKGRTTYYCTLPAANDAIILIPIETSGLEADSTLKDYDDIATLLAGSSNEQTTLGRKTITSVTVTVDDTNDRTDSDFADPVWVTSAGNAISKLIAAYDPDTTAGTDSSLIPLLAWDFVATPDGTDITGNVTSTGFHRAA